MGITYKAFDTDLRCPVVLKLISKQYLVAAVPNALTEFTSIRYSLRTSHLSRLTNNSRLALVVNRDREGAADFRLKLPVPGDPCFGWRRKH
jgi:hypothetical protein